MIAHARDQPAHEPIRERVSGGFLEAVVRTVLLPREQHIATRDPEIRRVAALLEGRIRKGQRCPQIAGPRECDRLGREQFGLVRELFERLVRPHLRFALFAEFDEHPHLTRPRRRALRIVFEHAREGTQRPLEIALLESRLRIAQVKRFILGDVRLRAAVFPFRIGLEFEIGKPAHGDGPIMARAKAASRFSRPRAARAPACARASDGRRGRLFPHVSPASIR